MYNIGPTIYVYVSVYWSVKSNRYVWSRVKTLLQTTQYLHSSEEAAEVNSH